MDPMTMALIGGGIAAGGSALGGLLARGQKESKTQRTARRTADELLASLKGDGPFSSLFQTSDADFNKSFRDPAMSMFNNQIAPQIQQQYIQSGQQRGTGLDDQLLRAGVDLDQMLNQQFMQFRQGGQDRMSNALSNIMGMQGAPQRMSGGQAALGGLAGFAGGGGLQNVISDYGANKRWDQYMQSQTPAAPPGIQPSSISRPQTAGKGYAQDWNQGYGY